MDVILVKSDGMHVPAAQFVGVFTVQDGWRSTLGRRREPRHHGIPRGPPLCDPFVMVVVLEVLVRDCATSTHPWETSLVAMIL